MKEAAEPSYTLCITHYNNGPTVESSMDSILAQIDERFEVIVVDNLSTDSSVSYLRKLASSKRIGLIEKRSSRGVGRQTAFENARGALIVANLDMDDEYGPRLLELLSFYHSKCMGKVLLAVSSTDPSEVGAQNITISSRKVIAELGGWRDLQFGEDWDLWSRAAKATKYAWTVFPMVRKSNVHEERWIVGGKIGYRYARYRDWMRLGRPVFTAPETVTPLQRIIWFFAVLSFRAYGTYSDQFNRSFNPYGEEYFVDST